MLSTKDINIRDPYVLVYEGKYYLYGTRGATCWGEADGFDCYVSEDLENWTEGTEVFHRPEGFWSDRDYWAPEVHFYKGSFYMFASFKNQERRRCTLILKADSPLGPFAPYGQDPVTPGDWECLDGTLYVSPNGTPYIVFCHEWQQIKDGTICALELSQDLSHTVGEPRTLFAASAAKPWIRGIEHRIYGSDNYVTDGPFMYRCENGRLIMLWSSFGEEGYTQAMAFSDNDDITGNWKPASQLLFEKDGGHGMIFKALDGTLYLALHSPNEHLLERPVFYRLKEQEGTLKVKGIKGEKQQ